MRKLWYRSVNTALRPVRGILCMQAAKALWWMRAIILVYAYFTVYFLVTASYYDAAGFLAGFLLVRYGIRTTRDLHKK
jgi:hypothetical protein